MITPHGFKTITRLTSAVTDFPQPQNLTVLCRFLGMTIVPKFLEDSPLQCLSRKYAWTAQCERSFLIAQRLCSSSLLPVVV